MEAPDNFSYVIPVDDLQHTQESPFCFADPKCPCHEDPELIGAVGNDVTNGLLTPDEATRLVKGETI